MHAIGEDETNDFNVFKALVDKTLKEKNIQLGASEKNAILNAVSWYDESAKKGKKAWGLSLTAGWLLLAGSIQLAAFAWFNLGSFEGG